MTAEEELFIRRHAAKNVIIQKPQQQQPLKQTIEEDKTPSVEPEAQFDFLGTHDEKQQLNNQHTENEQNINQFTKTQQPHQIAWKTNVKREINRLITESILVGNVRMPTKRTTLLFAWDVTIVLALLILLRAGVSSTLRWIHNRLNVTRGLSSNIPYEATVFECMQRPLEFLSLFTVGTALAEAVSRPLAATGLLRHIRTLRELGIIISATWFLIRWIERIRSRFSVAKSIDKAQVDATSRIATVITFVASVLISLDTIGINVQTVLAFGGIGGVAIGFAGREIISNFFGGFMIYITRPFSVGEWIRSIEEEELNGTVEDIGWYHTRVRTWDKRPLYIPNSRFSTLIVENGSRMDNRRILHTFHLRHEDMPVVPTIIAAMETLLNTHQELDPRQHRLVYVDSFGEYSVKIWLSCYTKSVFLYDYRRVQQEILIRFYELVRKHGAKLATLTTRDVRPGVDTDRYGPFGKFASRQQVRHVEQPKNNVPVSEMATSDVPLARPQDKIDIMQERFQTIESGLVPKEKEDSVMGGVNRVNGMNDSSMDRKEMEEESKSGRSMSAAAVAAAAAALKAARRNAARIEGGGRGGGVKTMNEDLKTDKEDMTVGRGGDTGGGTVGAGGEMKIMAGKGNEGSGTGSGGEMKIMAGKGGEGIGGGSGAEMKIMAGKGSEGSGAGSGGEMKIMTGKSSEGTGSGSAGEMKIMAVKSGEGGDGNGSGSGGEMKIMGTVGSRSNAPSSTNESPAGAATTGSDNINGNNNSVGSGVKSNVGNVSGEMKISKGRKPVSMSTVEKEGSADKDTNNSRTEGEHNN